MNHDSPILSTHTVPPQILEAREAYQDVRADYERALELRNMSEVGRIQPALETAMNRLLAVENAYKASHTQERMGRAV